MMKTVKKQKGFALLEVLIAALIMTVGGIAYMRLQQMGLQYSHNNYARTQGIAVANNFVDTLRNNIDYFSSGVQPGYITAKPVVGAGSDKISFANSCVASGSADGRLCEPEAVFNLQNSFIQQQLRTSSPNSVLCYQINNEGFVRVTYLWKDNGAESKDIALDKLNKGEYCPQTFNGAVDAKLKQNTVTIYAQL